ncbi:MAG TPA: DEAD/DEAH box helicase [Candidatus Thermoplasmatota archaeon]|nr:DEAD/DEAH box helicase [Candidatus Thermoplasmatota archaeon]
MESVFEGLDQRLRDLLTSQNIHHPTEPQCKAIPAILTGRHVLLIAPTGLGKTEAALLPIFDEFLTRAASPNEKDDRGISILYITPLRALNRDMLRRTFEWGQRLGIHVAVRHGDTSESERAKQAKTPPDMLITTPETLQILFTGKRMRKHLSAVHWVVVDEIHELAGDERGAQLAVGLERLFEITTQAGHAFQRIGLSATVGLPQEVARFLGGKVHGSFRQVTVLEIDVTKHIDIGVEMPTVQPQDYPAAQHLSIEPMSFALLRRCKELIDTHTSTLLFINTRDGAEILASRFHVWHEDMTVGVHHGSLSKHARIESENEFKSGKLKALICTSSLELGIDVGDTDFVIQYNSPREVTRIVQRIGRSGHRVGRTSKGMILATNPEDLAESLVIARHALTGSLEQMMVRQNPLSVLSNQVISLALEYGRIPMSKAYEILTRSYPFHSLPWKIFEALVLQLKNQRTLWLEEEQGVVSLVKRMNSRHYFLDNISMIPDEKTYPVIDISTRKSIGTLDERFVLSSGFEGEKFILRGRPWVIVKREENELLVSAIKEIGNVPSWVGEDIPVPFEVAQEVGVLRRLAATHQPISLYPSDHGSLQKFIDYITAQHTQGFIVPDDHTITFDVEEKTFVINACFGTKVNETLGRLVSAILAQSIGESIGINSDSYRITLELPGRIPPERIKDILLTTKPDTLEYLMKTILRNSTYLRWQLVHVARKFGALRKDFDYKNIGIKRLASLFEQSLIFEEALDKLLWERMDIEQTATILKRIQSGEITIRIQGLSPIALSGFETIRGLMVPQRADRSILMALKKRLEDSDITLTCTNCHHSWNTFAGRTPKQPRCPRCSAIKIAVLRRYTKETAKLLSKKHRTPEENKEVKRLHKNASLVLSYGRFAVLALVARGVGPDTAARILGRYNTLELSKSEELEIKFLRDILQAELQYARTRGFWDT